MEIWSNYSISFTNHVDPATIEELYKWIEKNDMRGGQLFEEKDGNLISLEKFTKLVNSNEVFKVEECNIDIYDFDDVLENMVKTFPKVNFEAYIYCSNCTAGITETGDFSGIDGNYSSDIEPAGYEDEDYWDEDEDFEEEE